MSTDIKLTGFGLATARPEGCTIEVETGRILSEEEISQIKHDDKVWNRFLMSCGEILKKIRGRVTNVRN